MRDNPTELFFTDRTRSLLSIDVSIDYDELFNYDKWTEDDIHSLLLAKFYLKNHFGIYISYLLILYFESRQSNDAPERLLRYWASERNWWRTLTFKHSTKIASYGNVYNAHKKQDCPSNIHLEMEKIIFANVVSITATCKSFAKNDDQRMSSFIKERFDVQRLYVNNYPPEEIVLKTKTSYTNILMIIKKNNNLINFIKFYETKDDQKSDHNNGIILSDNIKPLVNYKCVDNPIDVFFDFDKWDYDDLLCLLRLYVYEKRNDVMTSVLYNYILFLSDKLGIPEVQVILKLAVHFQWCKSSDINENLCSVHILNKLIKKGVFRNCNNEDRKVIIKSCNVIMYLTNRKSSIKDIEWAKNIIARRSKLRLLVLEQGMPVNDFVKLYNIHDRSILCYDLVKIKKLTEVSQCLLENNKPKSIQNKSKRK